MLTYRQLYFVTWNSAINISHPKASHVPSVTSPVVRFAHQQHKQQAHTKYHTHKDHMLHKTDPPLTFLELAEQLTVHCAVLGFFGIQLSYTEVWYSMLFITID